MSIAGLDWQTVQFPLVGGLDTKTQGQALDPPGLSSCKNVEFDDVGGLRLRKPYASIGTDIYGGGTLSSVRKIVVVGDELLAFTATTLYSWSDALTAWMSRGEHLAVATAEESLFGNTTDQAFVDRAQLGSLIVYVWTEVAPGSVACYLAARDLTTRATVIAPTLITAGSRPRVVALTTKIMVAWVDGLTVSAVVINPTAPTFSAAAPTTISSALSAPAGFDIVKDPAADQAVWVVSYPVAANYEIGKTTAALATTSSTKARISDGAIALAIASAADRVQVVRVDNTTGATDRVLGDQMILSTLVDSFSGSVLGTVTGLTVHQVTCAFRSVANGGAYRCYAFWSTPEFSGTESDKTSSTVTRYNYLDTGATLGWTDAVFIYRNGVASRAFDYNGSVYLWTVFAMTNTADGTTDLGFENPVQNTNYLYRDDGDFFAKSAWGRAGGYGYYTGHLAGVALVSGTTGFAVATAERDFTAINAPGFPGLNYADRSPRDVVITFDSDDARRVAQLGRTAYVSGSIVLQYDGEGLTEVGFEQFPWYIQAQDTGAGSMAAGIYSYKGSLRSANARNESERSSTAIGVAATVAANRLVSWWLSRLRVTKKTGSRRPPSIEMWRQVANAPPDAPYYLVTSRDPSATGNNGYVSNSVTSTLTAPDQVDNYTDAILATRDQHPENGNVLPRFAPPPASIVLASDSRLFLAGIPGDPYAVVYSLLRNEGEIAGFNGDLRFTIPATTGAITGLALQADTLVAFTASAIYIVPGEGYDNTGGGSNYGPPRLVSSDVGALSHDTIALTPGGLIFFSRKGWYRLSPGWDLEYIGAKVEDYNTDTWVAAQVVESQHQVRFLSSSRMLMFDYLVGEWSEWTQSGGRALARWRTYPMLLDTAVKKEQSTFAAADYTYEVVFGWLKPAQMQGMARVRRAMVLGEFKADHTQSISVGYDYLSTYTDGANHAFTGLTVGNPTQIRIGPSRQRCEAIRVKVSVTVSGTDCVVLTGLAFEVGLRRGLYARLPAAQKQ